jgi:hypothetical protein
MCVCMGGCVYGRMVSIEQRVFALSAQADGIQAALYTPHHTSLQ